MTQMKALDLKMTISGVPEKNIVKFFQSQTVTDEFYKLPEDFITYNFNKNHVVILSDFLRRIITSNIHCEELSEELAMKIEPIQIYGCPSNVVWHFTYTDEKVEVIGSRDGLSQQNNTFTIVISLKDPSQFKMNGFLKNLGIDLELQLSPIEMKVKNHEG